MGTTKNPVSDPRQGGSETYDWLQPDWPAPARVYACCTTRQGGVSVAPYDSLNLGDHVGDDPLAVEANRAALQRQLQLPQAPYWLNQVHGTQVLQLPPAHADRNADASVTTQSGCVCAILTADCLPLLICDRQGSVVAAAHAGWRGLAAGVIEATVAAVQRAPEELLVWLGPAIGPKAFEVGNDVRDAFVRHDPQAETAFVATDDRSTSSPDQTDAQRWYADLYSLARQRLHALGVTQVFGGNFCTWTDQHRFYSFRRDRMTGRMASLIWMID